MASNNKFNDITDVYAQQGFVIDFRHVPSKQGVTFKAFIPENGFEDVYESAWDSEEVYGRMDPIQNFKNTKRRINLTWDIPSSNFKEAKENQAKAELLLQMQYPMYENFGGKSSALGMKASPLFKVKFANLISSVLGSCEAGKNGNKSNWNYQGKLAASSGLVVTMAGLTYKPHFESGFFEDPSKCSIYPQTITFSCVMTVLHTHPLGFVKTGDSASFQVGPGFPYAPGNLVKETPGEDVSRAPPPPVFTLQGQSIPPESSSHEETVRESAETRMGK